MKGSQQGRQVVRLGLTPHDSSPYKQGIWTGRHRLREGAVRTQGGDGHLQASDGPGAVLAPSLCRNTLVWGFGPPDPEDVRLLELPRAPALSGWSWQAETGPIGKPKKALAFHVPYRTHRTFGICSITYTARGFLKEQGSELLTGHSSSRLSYGFVGSPRATHTR